MVVNAQSGVEGQPRADVLSEVHVACHFILVLIHDVFPGSGLFAFHILCPRLTAITEPVEAKSNAVSCKEPGTLVKRKTHHVIERIETSVLRLLACARRIAVVYPMVAPVIEKAQTAGGAVVVVFDGERSHAARDALVAFQQGGGHRTGISSVEVRHVHIGVGVPMVCPFIAQFGIASVLLERHILPMSVRAVVRAADDAGETSFADAVGQFRFQGVVRTISGANIRLDAVFVHLAGDDVYYTAHRIRTIQHRGRASQHFHLIRQ